MKTFAEIQQRAFETAKSKGWHEQSMVEGDERTPAIDRVLRSNALIHSEITEAWEAYSAHQGTHVVFGKPEGFAVECADVLIRVADTFAQLGFDLQDVMPSELNLSPEGNSIASAVASASTEAARMTTALVYLNAARMDVDRATEAARVGNWKDYQVHLGKTCTTLLAICEGLYLSWTAALHAKMRYNESRSYRHGGKQA